MLDAVSHDTLILDFDPASESLAIRPTVKPPRVPCPEHMRLTAFRFVPASDADRGSVYALRRAVLRRQVERLTPWDEAKQRARFERDFHVPSLRIIRIKGRRVGTVSFRKTTEGFTLAMFYVVPDCQGRMLGESVLSELLGEADSAGLPVRLTVLNGSRAAALYERFGFRSAGGDRWETAYIRHPGRP